MVKMKVLNDVLNYPLKIYQDQTFFCFSLDSIILANFAKINLRTKKILDLGTGNAIIPLILSLRTKAYIEGVEIQEDLYTLAQESIHFNHLDSRIRIYHQDMKEFAMNSEIFDSYDLIVSNPPYFKEEEKSIKNKDIHKVIARHEVMITLEEIIVIAFRLLKEGGTFCMIHRVDRFMEILFLLRKYHLEPKHIRFVYNQVESKANMFYLEAMKGAKEGMTIDQPFILYQNGEESEEYSRMKKEVL